MSFKQQMAGLASGLKNLTTKRKPEDLIDHQNPYITARRTWNDHVGSVISAKQTWQFLGIFCLLLMLVSLGGVIHIGSQSKFVPYVVQVDKQGQTVAMGPVSATTTADPRVIHAAVANFINDARIVTPDAALQRKAVFRVYSFLAPQDPATVKMNEFMNGKADSTPFKRAETEMVSIEIKTALQQTKDTWQVEWVETVRDRQGEINAPPFAMRALVTVYIAQTTPSTTDQQLRDNPLGIFVRDFSWSKVQ